VKIKPTDRFDTVLNDRERLLKSLRGAHRLLTCVYEPGTAPKRSTPLRMLAKDLGWLGTSMLAAGMGAVLASAGPIGALFGVPMTAVGVLVAIGRNRRLVVSHVHEASHGIVADFYRERGWPERRARRVAEAILDIGSSITMTLNGQDYRTTHMLHHEFEHLGTLGDPDGATLKAWHIWPDETPNLLAALVRTVLNPMWHLRFLRERIMSNVAKGRPYRRAMGAAILAMMVGSALVLPLPVWLAAVFLPFGPGYNIASLAQLTTIHPYGFPAGAKTLAEYAQRTWERIPYTPMPAEGADVAAWLRWSWSMVGHVIARMTVLDGTMIPHGYHHLAWPVGREFDDWWNTAQYWSDAHAAGLLPAGAENRIVWGLTEAWERQQAHFEKMRG
jgi:hypothetical protein